MKLKLPGGIYLFLIAFAIGLGELYVVRKANLALKRDPDLGRRPVPVTINGFTITLSFDTGSADTVLDTDTGKKLGLKRGTNNVVMTVAGSKAFNTYVDVGSTFLSGKEGNTLGAPDVYRSGQVAIISKKLSQIVPGYSRQIPPRKAEDILLNYDYSTRYGYEHIPYVIATINGSQVKAKIDTGNIISFMTHELAEQLNLIDKMHSVPKGMMKTGVIGGIDDVSLQIGNSRIISIPFFIRKVSHDPGFPVTIGIFDMEELGFTQVYGGTTPSRLIGEYS